MEKKVFETPTIEVVHFDASDVIATSSPIDPFFPGGGSEEGGEE